MDPIKIYIAEDDLEDRELFMEALSDMPLKIEVSQFDNGVDLMDNLFTGHSLPDVIFLDLRMPIMDGFECLTDIRGFHQFSHIKVIVYSSFYHQREVDQLERDGANHYLQKPNSFKKLKTLLYQSIQSLDKEQDGAPPFEILA